MDKKRGAISIDAITGTIEGMLRGWMHYGYSKEELKTMFLNALDKVRIDEP